jgi:poly(3-hydroxybutyrate) depolymerase
MHDSNRSTPCLKFAAQSLRLLVRRLLVPFLLVLFLLNPGLAARAAATEPASRRSRVLIPSSVDGSDQPCYLILPGGFQPEGPPLPLLVSLHTWSGDVQQRNEPLERLADQRGWIYLFPHFRGPNRHPDACGSATAQQDILDAVAWAREHYPVDPRRIYLTGVSGGGHMTLLMVGRHPEIWAAASAWVPISDLTAWHALHAEGPYGAMVRASCGGAPGDSPEVDRQYRQRSPITHLHRARGVPLDIAAGVHDGHTGSVPIQHSLDAFNVVAAAVGVAGVCQHEVAQLSRRGGKLDDPRPSDRVEDAVLGRRIYLRRYAGRSRVTIFDGGHEGIAAAAVDWLERHERAALRCDP